MDPQNIALTFALYQGDTLVRRETITQKIVKVGKDPRSHLRVDDEQAARMHAVIQVDGPEDITLIDLGTDAGTVVNGQRVNKCKIRPGDQVQIGGTTINFESTGAASATAGLGGGGAVSLTDEALLANDSPEDDVVTSAVGNPFAAPPPRKPALPSAPASTSNPPFHPHGAAAAAEENTFGSPAEAVPVGNPFSQPVIAANPFVTQAAVNPSYAMNAPGGSDFDPSRPFTYQLLKNGPDVNPDEVEMAHVATVEVMVLWGGNALSVAHLTPPRSYYVGEEGASKQVVACDYFVPSEILGTTRAPIVVSRSPGSSSLVILPRSKGTIEIPGQGKMMLEDLVSSGKARPSSELSGAHEFDMPAGAKARMEMEGGLVFQVTTGNAGKPVAAGFFSEFEPAAYLFTGLSFLLHAGIIGALAFFMPSMGADDVEAMDRDQLLLMQKLLDAAAEKEQEEKQTDDTSAEADNKEGGTGTRAKGEEGSMGNPNTAATGHRFGVQGPQDNADPHIARQAALREAAEFGMIGLLNTGGGGDPNAPTAPWGREDSLGNDPMSARGNMWGDTIGESFGAGGLGLSGTGEGGGGRGEGIGLGNIGTIGHGAGTGTGQGFGSGHGSLRGGHQTKAPSIRQGTTQVNGRLPAEVIQRIVRQNFGRFRLCYENGLRTNPNLSGRVAVRFVIDRSGAVSTASDGGSDLPDRSVVSCVVRGFGNLSFPQPEGGIVTVVYPIIFNPGD